MEGGGKKQNEGKQEHEHKDGVSDRTRGREGEIDVSTLVRTQIHRTSTKT